MGERSKPPASASPSGSGGPHRKLPGDRTVHAVGGGHGDSDRAAIGYLVLLHQFRVSEAPEEREFGTSQAGEELVQVYIEPISIDALNHSMRGHVSLVASRALRG